MTRGISFEDVVFFNEKEEKEVLDSFEKGEWLPVADLASRKKELSDYARNTLKKDKRLNIRISERDLIELQRKAVKEDRHIRRMYQA